MSTLVAQLLFIVPIALGGPTADRQERPDSRPPARSATSNLIQNGDFETGLSGWAPFWSRDADGGRAAIDQLAHGGTASLRIEHRGDRDWSQAVQASIPVAAGEIYAYSGWARNEGPGHAEISVILRDEAGRAVQWSYAPAVAPVSRDWQRLHSRFMIPRGVTTMTPRAIGSGRAAIRLDDLALTREGESPDATGPHLPGRFVLRNEQLELILETADGRLSVKDRRNDRAWSQVPARVGPMLTAGRESSGAVVLELIDPATLLEFNARIALVPGRPELLVEVSGAGDLRQSLGFPHPFQSPPGGYLVLPINEGMSYPVDDPDLPELHEILYGGHGLCMAWWGVTDGKSGMMAIVETPDDASVRTPRVEGRLSLSPLWDPQKGRIGTPRRLRYVFLDDGGHVAMAKRYRAHARAAGLLKTLERKRAENPNVDRLVGAVNVWCWDRDAVAIVRELQEAGIDRILWSAGGRPEAIKAMNALGVLTSRYDIYQDVMDPAAFPKLHGVHPDWTTKAWPDDLMREASGAWIRGWEVEGRDGKRYPCGVTCDRRAIPYAVERIGRELGDSPYLCRFIDTTTASPWRECYDSRHPLTRSESRRWKMELLRTVSERFRLVTGSETGHEAAVPFVHYFEGMLSLGPYRIDEAGRDMQRIVRDVPPQIAKYQVGAFYRLPLWELVYHDCVVAQWYWGDYSNKLPAVWDRRDLFNALYGTPPMFMFDRRLWEKERDRFMRSYRTVCPIARSTGFSEMLSHRWVTPDHSVQETYFANGQTVTVNLGDREFRFPDGSTLAAKQLRVTGISGPTGGR